MFDDMRLTTVIFLSQLSLCCYLLQQSTSSTDTISPTQPLKDGQILTSPHGSTFALGFFSPANSTQRRYLGIWYNKVPVQTVVWVANRDRPINGTAGILSIAPDGNLQLLSSHNSTASPVSVWSTHHQSSRSTDDGPPIAQLHDSGNLVLLFGTSGRAWQSFDYPTHVLLPGMMLGLDRRTGFSRSLSSWRSPEDPARGNYTFAMADPDGGSPEFFLYRDGSVPVWRTGPWVGDRWSGVPEMTRGYIFNYSFVDTADQVYITYGILNGSIASMFVLDGESGTVQRKTWHPSTAQWIKFWAAPQEDCDAYAHCGASGLCNPNSNEFGCTCFPGYEPKSPRDWYLRDATEGCVRARNVSECRNGEGFVKMGNLKVPDTSTAKTNLSMNLGECRQECLNNCSCVAFTTAIDATATVTAPVGCILFHDHLMDTRIYDASGGQDLYFRVDAVELARSVGLSKDNFSKRREVIVVVGTISSLAFIICFGCLLYLRNKREYLREQERNLWLREAGQINSDSVSPVFRFSVIAAATRNFDASSCLGEGGFGPVYKGKLPSGQEIAVKRLSKNSGQGIEEFKNEVRLISKLQHKNLVKILGCCVRGDEKMLIYEFLPNKSLSQNIFEERQTVLDWSKRYEIILGIARGVLYLHQDSRLKIIHRDLKASNILLDAEMNPKISDFGMARIFGNDQSEANTNRVVGTYGYMSPEYAMEGLFSIKSDVFSFGVMLIEIISGQRSSGYYNDNLSTNLIGYVWALWKDGNVMEMVDKSIVSSLCEFEDEIKRCIQIGLLCVQENPNERPTMLEVTFMLSNKSNLPDPNEPAFIIKRNHDGGGGDPISSSYGTQSVNDLTISMVNAR